MRIWQSGSGVESRIGDPIHPYSTIVTGQILDHPINGVIGIGTFVDVSFIFWVIAGNVGGHVVELPIAHVTTAYVLKGDDVSILNQILGWVTAREYLCVVDFLFSEDQRSLKKDSCNNCD